MSEKCAKCGMLPHAHHPLCEAGTLEYKAWYLGRLYPLLEKVMKQRDRLLEQATLWQGKHAILKHENNKLRRANERLKKEH